ncbi:uncharacterized protein I206_102948 [Kwoniella pini CBS 10737]|uniref:Uncharacterized protein n=1 Tax=Kwoniella pini CBS 10737 TaxID=1296096 RepID=A0A1B9I6R9_9TREE|nr:uncharacterized protein I206_03299 [Kwoniella pini CBS 10737]OCF51233.1 hypothetical protein I206_03299 [Kwoniella pini CBS 10737]
MARPGQAALRRKRAREEMEISSSTTNYPTSHYDYVDTDNVEQGEVEEQVAAQGDNPRSQCLPVGILPEDFDGTPLDGSQYLAMANRDNADLPFAKSVNNPFKIDQPSTSMINEKNNATASSSSSSRHPALPKESWEAIFPLHFQGYRKHIRSQLSSSDSDTTPYPADYPPLPRATVRPEWYAFINGYIPQTKNKKGKEKAKPKPILTEEELMNIALGGEEADMEITQEAVEAEVVESQVVVKTSRGNEKRVGKPREPLLSVLRNLTPSQALIILSHFSLWITESLENAPPPLPSSPEIPISMLDKDQSFIKAENSINSSSHLSTNYFNWIFSLLLIIDDYLTSDEISILRELARASMKVAGHRWITGVVGKDIGENWVLGNEWKVNSLKQTGDKVGIELSVERGKEDLEQNSDGCVSENRVDEVLARSWMIVHAVSAGWGQKDLLMELNSLFA